MSDLDIPKPPRPSKMSLHPEHDRVVRERFARQLEQEAAEYMRMRRPGRAFELEARVRRIRYGQV